MADRSAAGSAPDPGFLSEFDRDAEAALASFYAYARNFFATRPPRELRLLTPDDREDVVQDFIVHCCQRNCRVLRSYRAGRVPFSAWFYYVARNHVLDWCRRHRRRLAREAPTTDELRAWLPQIDATAERELQAKELWLAVGRCLEDLGDRCRTLLLGAAQGCRPRELVALVGETTSESKRVSDDLRYCRRKLLDALERAGYTATELGLVRGRKP